MTASDGSTPAGPEFDGPTDLTLGSLVAAAWESWERRWSRFIGGGYVAELVTGAWALAMSCCVSCFAPFGPGSAGAAVAMVALWVVSVAAVGFRTAAGLIDEAVRTVREPSPKVAPIFVPWGGRLAACGVLPTVVATTAIMLPLLAAEWAGTGFEAAGIAAGVALLIVPAALFVAFWPAAYLIPDREELAGLRPLAAAWEAAEGDRGAFAAAGLVAYASLAWPVWLFVAGALLFPRFPTPLVTLGGAFLVWPWTAPPAFLLLAHAHDRAERARGERVEPQPDEPGPDEPPPVEPRGAGLS